MIACDAQTSGGLLICIPPHLSDAVLKELVNAGLIYSAMIRCVTDRKHKLLHIENYCIPGVFR